jgi:hypothetical protein
MTVYVKRAGEWVDKRTGAPMVTEEQRNAPIALPFVLGDIPEYTSPIDGNVITSRSQRREDLKRNNCVDARDFPSPTQGKIRNQAFAAKRGLQVSKEFL